MIFRFFTQLIIFLSLISLNNFLWAEKSTEEDLGPLDQQAKELINDLKKSIKELSKPSNTLSINIDILLEDFEEHLIFIKNKIDNNDLESAAYAMDFLINAVTEISSSIPSETKLNLSNIKFDELDEEKNEIMKDILTDITTKKINFIKDSMHYAIQLKKSGLDSIETINKINTLGLGFDQLDNDLTEVDLDLSKIAELDFAELETALESLNEINMEEVTQEIEERIAESIEIIEDVVEEIAEAVAQTAGEVMAEINSALGTAMNVEVYAWLIGVDGVTSSMSFSDAVNLFNEQYGLNLSDEEAREAIENDVCWLYGLCE